MVHMKYSKILFFTAAFVQLIFYTQLGVADERPMFLSEDGRKFILNSTSVRAYREAPMKYTPMLIVPEKLNSAIPLTHKQEKELKEILLSARKIDPIGRFATCHYQPGVGFTFIDSSYQAPQEGEIRGSQPKVLSLQLCFNCDVWSLGSSSTQGTNLPNRVIGFGDSKSERERLIALAKELFGEDFVEQLKK